MADIYPPGTVRALLSTNLVTPPTRAALETRLSSPADTTPQFFPAPLFETLRALSLRLFPNAAEYKIDLALTVDARLARGDGNGWRYDALPPDGEAYTLGLQGINQSAQTTFAQSFADLDVARQETILRAVQSGEALGEIWKTLPSPRFWEELLAELTEIYYGHPLAQEEIGYAGMADGRGWRRIGLNELEDWGPIQSMSWSSGPGRGERRS